MTTIEETERAVSTAPPLEWVRPHCPICGEQVEPIIDGQALKCPVCHLWWSRDGKLGTLPSNACGQYRKGTEVRCIRREGHPGHHAAYSNNATELWDRTPLEQIGDALRQRRALEMSGEDFEMLVSDILEREGVR